MTQNKLHKFIPYILLVMCLMLCVESGAQRARRQRQGNNTIKVDSLVNDTKVLDTIGGKKGKQPLDAPVVY